MAAAARFSAGLTIVPGSVGQEQAWTSEVDGEPVALITLSLQSGFYLSLAAHDPAALDELIATATRARALLVAEIAKGKPEPVASRGPDYDIVRKTPSADASDAFVATSAEAAE